MLRKLGNAFKNNSGFATAVATWILFLLLAIVLIFCELMLVEIGTGDQFVKEIKLYGACEEGLGLVIDKLAQRMGKADLRISEVMNFTNKAADERELEYIELYNNSDDPITINNNYTMEITGAGAATSSFLVVNAGLSTGNVIPARGTALVVGASVNLTNLLALVATYASPANEMGTKPLIILTLNGSAGLDISAAGAELPDNANLQIVLNNGGLIDQYVNTNATTVVNYSWEKYKMWYNNVGVWITDGLYFRQSIYAGGTPGYACEPMCWYGDEFARLTRSAAGGDSPISNPGSNITVSINVIDEASKIPVNSNAFAVGSGLATIADNIQLISPAFAITDLVNYRPFATSEDLRTVREISNSNNWAFTVYSRFNANQININTADTTMIKAISVQGGNTTGTSDTLKSKIRPYRLGNDRRFGSADDVDCYYTDRSHLFQVVKSLYGGADANIINLISSKHLMFRSDGFYRVIVKGTRNIDPMLEKKMIFVIRIWNQYQQPDPKIAVLFFQEEYKNLFPSYSEDDTDSSFGL